LTELHRAGKGDYFRVLYGRLCEQMTMPEIADALGIKVTSAENHYKAARKRLAAILEDLVRQHVARYAPDSDREEEFAAEWAQLGDYLTQHGGLDQAVRDAYAGIDPAGRQQRKTAQINSTLSRILSNPRS
jgi:AcrR family transcriptional regulator